MSAFIAAIVKALMDPVAIGLVAFSLLGGGILAAVVAAAIIGAGG